MWVHMVSKAFVISGWQWAYLSGQIRHSGFSFFTQPEHGVQEIITPCGVKPRVRITMFGIFQYFQFSGKLALCINSLGSRGVGFGVRQAGPAVEHIVGRKVDYPAMIFRTDLLQ